MQTLNYTYDCRRPLEGEAVIDEQISTGHKYYNQLIELHRQRIVEYRDRRRELFPDLDALEEQTAAVESVRDDLRDAIKRRNAAARRKQPSEQDADEVRCLLNLLGSLWEHGKAMRAELRDSPEMQAFSAEQALRYDGEPIPGSVPMRRRGGLFKAARADCGLYSGTYLKVEAAVDDAVKKSIDLPRFRRWNGCGRVAVQIQGGMCVDELLSCKSTHLRMEAIEARGNRGKALATFAVRIQSDDRGKPVWCRIPVYYHRPLPADAQIIWATLLREAGEPRRQSDGRWRPYYRWRLQLAIRTGVEHERASAGECGVDIGWRLLADGRLRVAVVATGADTEEFCLPQSMMESVRLVEDLQGIRSKAFDAIKLHLQSWLSTHTAPDWLTEATEYLHQWRSQDRLCRLVDLWRTQRFAGDDDIYPELQAWREREAHLLGYEIGRRSTVQRQRKKQYEQFAARLRGKYASVAVEDCDWRKLMRLKPAETDKGEDGAMKRWQRLASVGLLRECLVAAGATMVKSENTTTDCHACGHRNEVDRSVLMQTCERCGAEFDQDANAARNLLSRARIEREDAADASRVSEGDAGDAVAETPSVGGGKWARRKSNRSQKMARTA